MKDQKIVFYSRILKKNMDVRLLIPSGENLKCLFLLHGYGGDHNQWAAQTKLAELAESMGILAVLPSCGNGYYEDTQENMPAFLGEELVEYIKSKFPISARREDLYVGGVSMGGFGALLIGAKYPHVFGKILSFSGAFILSDVVIGNPGVLGNADPKYFKEVFGEFDTLEGSSRDPLAEALRASQALGKLLLICGGKDVLYPCNLKILAQLRAADIDADWYSDAMGGHGWAFWNDALPYALAWLKE